MSRTVYLLRHAKSSWEDPGLADIERPLAPRGRKAAKKIARYLRDHDVRPELVLCSPAARARETLAAIGEGEIRPELYGASAPDLLGVIRGLSDSVSSVMLVGHNPGMEELACAFAPLPGKTFPTGAVATFAFDCERWAGVEPGGAVLVDYVVPREL
jgi:phosphohistidine phosphatase